MNFKIDTGADVDVISKKTWTFLGKSDLCPANSVMLLIPGGRMDVVGRLDTSVGEELSATIYIIDNDTDSLLWRTTAATMGLV